MKNDVHTIDEGFCARCGITLNVEPKYRNVPVMCPVCMSRRDDEAIEKGVFGEKKDIIGCSWRNGKIYVVTYSGDLGPTNRPQVIERWPEKVFSILADSKSVCFPATRWIFDMAYFPAVEKIITATGKKLVLYQR